MAKELESDAKIITVEIDEGEAELAKKIIRKAEVKLSIILLVGDTLDIIPKLD